MILLFLLGVLLLFLGFIGAAAYMIGSVMTGMPYRNAEKHAVNTYNWHWWEMSPGTKQTSEVTPDSSLKNDAFVTVRMWVDGNHRLYVGSPSKTFGKTFGRIYGSAAANTDRPNIPEGELQVWRQRWPRNMSLRDLVGSGIDAAKFSDAMEGQNGTAAVVVVHHPLPAPVEQSVMAHATWKRHRAAGNMAMGTSGSYADQTQYQNSMYVNVISVNVGTGTLLGVTPLMSTSDRPDKCVKMAPAKWRDLLDQGIFPTVRLSPYDPYFRVSKMMGPLVPWLTDTNQTGSDSTSSTGLQYAPLPFAPIGDGAPLALVAKAASPPSTSDAVSMSAPIGGNVPAIALGKDQMVAIGTATVGGVITEVGIPLESLPFGLLTSGAPGTGKSLLLTTLAGRIAALDRNNYRDSTHLVMLTKSGAVNEVSKWLAPHGFRTSADWADYNDPGTALYISAKRGGKGIPFSLIDPAMDAAQNAHRIADALSYSADEGMMGRAEGLARAVFTLAMLMPQNRRDHVAEKLQQESVSVIEMVALLLNQMPHLKVREDMSAPLDEKEDDPVADPREWQHAMGSLMQWYPKSGQPKVDALEAVRNKVEPLMNIPGWWDESGRPTITEIINRSGPVIFEVPGPSGSGASASAPSAIAAHMVLTTLLSAEEPRDAPLSLYQDELAHLAAAAMGPPTPILGAIDQGRSAGIRMFVGFQRLDQLHPQIRSAVNQMRTVVALAQSDPETAEAVARRLTSAHPGSAVNAAAVQNLAQPGGAFVSTRTGDQTPPPFPIQTFGPPESPAELTAGPAALEAPEPTSKRPAAVRPAGKPVWKT